MIYWYSYQLKLDPDSFHFHQAEDWEMLLLQTGNLKRLLNKGEARTRSEHVGLIVFLGQSPFSRRKLADNGPAEDEFDF